MVTLSLFDTLLSLNSEPLMTELLLKFLVPGRHIPAAHRHKVNRCDGYSLAVDHFLDLTPEVMKLQQLYASASAAEAVHVDVSGAVVESSGASIGSVAPRSLQHGGVISKTIGANWNHYGVHSGNGDTLYANYRAYLFDARQKIAASQRGCARWSQSYLLVVKRTKKATAKTIAKEIRLEAERLMRLQRTEKTRSLIREFFSEFALPPVTSSPTTTPSAAGTTKQLDSLQSIGESSGYESFKYRVDGDDDGTSTMPPATTTNDSSNDDTNKSSEENVCVSNAMTTNITLDEHRWKVDSWKTSSRRRSSEVDTIFTDDELDEFAADEEKTVSLGK